MELEEVPNEFIRTILGRSHSVDCRFVRVQFSHFVEGNWDAKTQEISYSSKLTVASMHVMVGYSMKEGHHIVHMRVTPAEDLQKMIWP